MRLATIPTSFGNYALDVPRVIMATSPRQAGAKSTEKAGGEEIEITSEMIEAGMRELAYFDPREDSPEGREEIVAEIYRAMSIANLRK
jgi:hypothetical protein